MKTRTSKYMAALLAVSLSAVGLSAPVQAYVTNSSWGSNKIVMRASSVSFPSGSSYRTALGTITSRYYNNPSEMWFEQRYDDTSVGFDNDQNEVWFSGSSSYDPAVTFTWTSWWSGDIVEADVVFYSGESYTTSMNKTSLWSYGGSYRPFETTAIHEYGHAAGLAHESDEYNVMGQDWTHINCNGNTCRSYVGEDASDGLVALYGRASGGVFEDVSVSLFKWSGRSGEYSTHALSGVYTTAGATVSSAAYNGQRRYNVSKGSTYQFEFSYENNGETTQSVRAGYYLSTDNYISTSDTLLATTTFSLGRDSVLTYRRSLTIPTNISANTTYYIGVIVDDDNRLAETDSANNAAYHIIKTGLDPIIVYPVLGVVRLY